jgi:hypothetical protein
MHDRRSARTAGIALAASVVACAAASAPGDADLAPADRLPPALAAIETTCNAERVQTRPEDALHLVRLPAQDGGAGAWLLATPAGAANVESAASFRSGDFVTVVFDHAAIVRADLIHDDVTTATVLAHDWCFIGGKLARATADVSFTTTAGADGYRRTRYYGDDLEHPLGETMLEKNDPSSPGAVKKYAPPAPAVDAILVTEPVARPAGLPFYDAVVAARAGRLPHLRK